MDSFVRETVAEKEYTGLRAYSLKEWRNKARPGAKVQAEI